MSGTLSLLKYFFNLNKNIIGVLSQTNVYLQFLSFQQNKYKEGLMDRQLVQTDGSEQALFNKVNISLNHAKKGQTLLDFDLNYHAQIGQHPCLINKGFSFPSPLQTNIYSPCCVSTSVTAPLPSSLAAESANTPSQLRQTVSYTNRCADSGDKLKDQGVTIESGTVSISTIYSQG